MTEELDSRTKLYIQQLYLVSRGELKVKDAKKFCINHCLDIIQRIVEYV